MGKIEPLEPRRLLAVTAFTDGQTLTVRGDGTADAVEIGLALDRGRTFIYADGLTVNGQSADGRYFFNKPILDIDMAGGADTLRLSGGSYTVAGPEARFGTSTIRMGDGDDRVIWADGGFDALTVDLGAGDDRLSGAAFRIRGQLTLLGGSGRDRFGIQNADFINALVLNDRSGPTVFESISNAFGGIAINTGNSADRVTVIGGTLTGVFGVVTRGGNDTITLTDYLQPLDQRHNVEAGDGENIVIDMPKRRPTPTGRVDATLDGTTLTLVGTGGIRLGLVPQYGSMEETVGTAVVTDGNLFVNGTRKPTRAAMFNWRTPIYLVRIRLDDAAQTVDVDYDSLVRTIGRLDIASGGGDDVIDVAYGPWRTAINSGAGDDRVRVNGSNANTSIDLGPGRDRFAMGPSVENSLELIDKSGPAYVALDGVRFTGNLEILTSDAIDRITLDDVTAGNVRIGLRGGVDVYSETNLVAGRRTVSLGEQ